MKKLIGKLIAPVMLALVVTACSGGDNSSAAAVVGSDGGGDVAVSTVAAVNAERPVVAVLTPNATHGFTGDSIRHAHAAALELADEFNVDFRLLASAESNEQNNQITTMINDQVDVIVLWPHNGDEVRSGALSIEEAGIPLVVYNRLIPGFIPTAEVAGDNVGIGRMAGEYFNQFFEEELAAGQVNILEFRGDNSIVPIERNHGFEGAMHENINIVQSFVTGWQRQTAMEHMETFFNTSSVEEIESIKAIFTHDDEVVLGVLDAIENYNGPANLDIRLISGIGGRAQNLEMFESVYDRLNIYKITYEFSPVMVRDPMIAAARIANGENVTGTIRIPTFEVDSTTIDEFMTSESFTRRYSLD